MAPAVPSQSRPASRVVPPAARPADRAVVQVHIHQSRSALPGPPADPCGPLVSMWRGLPEPPLRRQPTRAVSSTQPVRSINEPRQDPGTGPEVRWLGDQRDDFEKSSTCSMAAWPDHDAARLHRKGRLALAPELVVRVPVARMQPLLGDLAVRDVEDLHAVVVEHHALTLAGGLCQHDGVGVVRQHIVDL
jgi:hypothetical protein